MATILWALLSTMTLTRALAPPSSKLANRSRSMEDAKNSIVASDMDSEENSLDASVASRRQFLSAAAAGATSSTLISSAHASTASTSSSTITSTTASTTTATAVAPLTAQQVFAKASQKALSGGKAGASASVLQVLAFMWLRTAMNYQYRYGGTLSSSLNDLYAQGGVTRLYQGLPFALVQGPLTRFGDTAANVGILALLESFAWSAGLPLPLRTAAGSITAGLWRIVLMPIDTSKTMMQVSGRDGLDRLWTEVQSQGVGPLYRGALASAGATAVGHYPWFLTYNFLNDVLPLVEKSDGVDPNVILLYSLGRSAVLGLCASCVSDCCSNSLRVIKTTKQTAEMRNANGKGDKDGTDAGGELSYKDAVGLILEQDGWVGLFGRGLQTRLLTNALQGALFSVLWRYFQQVQS